MPQKLRGMILRRGWLSSIFCYSLTVSPAGACVVIKHAGVHIFESTNSEPGSYSPPRSDGSGLLTFLDTSSIVLRLPLRNPLHVDVVAGPAQVGGAGGASPENAKQV